MALADWRYPDWKAPADDGQMLIWPQPHELLRDARDNHRHLAAANSVNIQNVPLPALRSSMRQWLGHAHDDQPLVAMGHQTELYHAGVWAKDVLIHHAAAKLGGQAYHFAVDTDHPKHLSVRWPGESITITDDPALGTAAWSGLLAPPTPQHLQKIEQDARHAFASMGFEPTLFAFLDSLRPLALDPGVNLSSMITNAQHQLDWQLGLRHHALLVSPIFVSPAYLAFAHDLISRPDAFAAVYNGSLAEYRARTGTKSAMRPMPNLFVGPEATEVPFWIDDLASGTRSRPSVFRAVDGEGWVLSLLSGEEFVFRPGADGFEAAELLARFLARTSHRLSPCALTLTLFLRLLVADQFVHGIGGGRYDQVTDQIIARHYGIAPPKFAVTTATSFFPGAVGKPRVCLLCVAQDGHRLKHSLLGPRKRELVAQIESLPRRSRQRQDLFLKMHQDLRAAAALSVPLKKWRQAFDDAQARAQEESVLFDRELFYATQSRDRLEMMIDRYRSAFTASA